MLSHRNRSYRLNSWSLLIVSGPTAIASLTLGIATSARATESMGLNFDLAAAPAASSPLPAIVRPTRAAEPLLPAVGSAPIGSETSAKPLPPPPTVPNAAPAIQTPTQRSITSAATRQTSQPAPKAVLNFALSPTRSPTVSATIDRGSTVPAAPSDIFAGDSDSLVATAVGSAEGTRTPAGGYTWAYQGHVDPGNGAWNLGSFSYQHGANSPREADRRQLARLRTQAQTLRRQADRYGMRLTLVETLNGIDLANQSPRAALNRGGYIDRLHQAHEMGLQGADAILWARTRAFLDPDTARWNAPGLGNNVHSITADQERRRRAIDRVISRSPATSP